MRSLIYIKVYRGYFTIRSFRKTSDRTVTCRGLNHPRTLAGDFASVESSFRAAVREEPSGLLGLLKPKILVHLVPEVEGGYTDLELRFFREAALVAGSGQTHLLTSEYGPLGDDEIATIDQKR